MTNINTEETDQNIFEKLEEFEKARFVEHVDGSFGARINLGGASPWVVVSTKRLRKYFTDIQIIQQGFSIVGEPNSLLDNED